MPETTTEEEAPLSPAARDEVIELLTAICGSLHCTGVRAAVAWANGEDKGIATANAAEFMRSKIDKILQEVKGDRDAVRTGDHRGADAGAGPDEGGDRVSG